MNKLKMNKKGFTEKDLLKWIAIIAAISLIYVIIKTIFFS